MRDDNLKERVRETVDIVEVIGERLPLKKAGKNFTARCPFHVEKTPSFNVNPERQIYYCFGCGAGGDVYRFLMEYDKLSFPEALRLLAEKVGITMDRGVQGGKKSGETNDAYYEANALARQHFADSMADEAVGVDAREYFAERALSDETVQKFGLGYAPDTWDGLLKLSGLKGISQKNMVDAGLLVQNEQGRVYDRFRGRVMFPIANTTGRVVAFGARTLDPDGEPKYLNSPESPIYRKSSVLYGLFHARDGIREHKRVLIAEGYMDVLQLMQAGVENAVATCGTALTREHGALLKRYSDQIVLIFDGDTAGVRAAMRAGDVLLEAGIEARVALLPEGDDPDTFVLSEGPEALHALADGGTPFLQFKWRQLGQTNDLTTATGRNQVIGEMLDSIVPVEDELLRNIMASQIAEWGRVDESLVGRAMKRRSEQRSRRRQPKEEETAPVRKLWRPPRPEKLLLALMLDRPPVCTEVGTLDPECFTDDTVREMISELVRLAGEGAEVSATALMDVHAEDDEWTSSVASLGQVDYDTESVDRAVTELIESLSLNELKRRIDGVRDEMREPGDMERARYLAAEYQSMLAEYERRRSVVMNPLQ
jgi:DNA primase